LELLAEHQARLSDHSRAIWTLIVLSEWLMWFSRFRHEPASEAIKVYSDGV
jgi:asparagine synthase (glutamine-hydrolysing)